MLEDGAGIGRESSRRAPCTPTPRRSYPSHTPRTSRRRTARFALFFSPPPLFTRARRVRAHSYPPPAHTHHAPHRPPHTHKHTHPAGADTGQCSSSTVAMRAAIGAVPFFTQRFDEVRRAASGWGACCCTVFIGVAHRNNWPTRPCPGVPRQRLRLYAARDQQRNCRAGQADGRDQGLPRPCGRGDTFWNPDAFGVEAASSLRSCRLQPTAPSRSSMRATTCGRRLGAAGGGASSRHRL